MEKRKRNDDELKEEARIKKDLEQIARQKQNEDT